MKKYLAVILSLVSIIPFAQENNTIENFLRKKAGWGSDTYYDSTNNVLIAKHKGREINELSRFNENGIGLTYTYKFNFIRNLAYLKEGVFHSVVEKGGKLFYCKIPIESMTPELKELGIKKSIVWHKDYLGRFARRYFFGNYVYAYSSVDDELRIIDVISGELNVVSLEKKFGHKLFFSNGYVALLSTREGSSKKYNLEMKIFFEGELIKNHSTEVDFINFGFVASENGDRFLIWNGTDLFGTKKDVLKREILIWDFDSSLINETNIEYSEFYKENGIEEGGADLISLDIVGDEIFCTFFNAFITTGISAGKSIITTNFTGEMVFFRVKDGVIQTSAIVSGLAEHRKKLYSSGTETYKFSALVDGKIEVIDLNIETGKTELSSSDFDKFPAEENMKSYCRILNGLRGYRFMEN